MQQKVEPPPELNHPKNLLRARRGVRRRRRRARRYRGWRTTTASRSTPTRPRASERYTRPPRIVTIRGSGEVTYVFKHFADFRSMKWAFLNIWSLSMKFSMSPQARMHREYSAARKLRAGRREHTSGPGRGDRRQGPRQGVHRGKSRSRRSWRRYSGASPPRRATSRGTGRSLGKVHQAGFALGDAKAENVIVKEDTPFLTDLEQAVEEGDQPWDIAEFLYYSGKLSLREDGIRVVANAFLDGYARENGKENIAKARASKYLLPFRAVVTLQIQKVIREALERHST